MPIPRPRLFTIPPSAPFLPTLIEALVAGKLVAGFPAARDPLALAQATLYLPTRRACRLARRTFIDSLGLEAAVLPRILPIGDVDEDALVFEDAAGGPAAAAALELPPALGGLDRRLQLAQIVLKWSEAAEVHGSAGARLVAAGPAAALALADDLARLIDDMATRKVPWSRLDDLVPDEFDKYWQLTLRFLRLAREAWPAMLAEQGVIEAVERRDRLIDAEAARLATADAPVIAAGSTASIPATARLLSTIARLPQGAVVLPGLDTDLPDPAWRVIAGGGDGAGDGARSAAGHPQYAMAAFLREMEVERDAVAVLGTPANRSRERLVSHALCPAAASECWQERLDAATVTAALGVVTVIEAANAEEEALAIAVAMREAVETAGKQVVLATPDRALARRVVAALARWNVAVDDSGGDEVVDAPAGIFALLAAEAALGGLDPVTLLALLKHPRLSLGLADGPRMAAVAVLEGALLRGPRPRPGTAGLAHALETFCAQATARRGRAAFSDGGLDRAADLVRRLAAALAPLEAVTAPAPFAELAARHREVLAALEAIPADAPFPGEDGAALARAFDDIAGSAGAARLMIERSDYADLLRAALAGRVMRRPERANVRARVLGLLEARLQRADRIVLGGLVEGIWPPETNNDAWLSRPMRRDLGLDLPERRIGLTAHDFTQLLGNPEIVLARAVKVAGAPTLWSRFVQRLAAVAGETAWKEACARGDRYVGWARSLDHPATVAPAPRPAPAPPLAARPARLSVTEIEHWLRDPYTIYAKHVLGLAPLDVVDTPPGVRDRGTAIHAAVAEFARKYPAALPDDPLRELIAIGRAQFAPLDDYPEARAFWWPRFLRVARWFVSHEAERRAVLAALHIEINGRLEIAAGEHPFTLTVRADRIERLADGRYAIIDYKTGRAPTERQVRAGLSPQLTLEAAILRGGGFEGIAPASVAELAYVELRGGDPAGEAKPVAFKEGTPDSQAETALARLRAIVARFADETQPYPSLVHPMWTTHYGDYDHLARVKEWSETGGAEAEDGAA